jgi:lipoyl(octanoyl) transferase
MNGTFQTIDWTIGRHRTPYPDAVSRMEQRVEAIHRGEAAQEVWLLEHPPLYTAGTSAQDGDLLAARFPVFKTGRGGQYTYHGPGQRVAYVMLDLKRRKNDVRRFVRDLEEWLIRTLAEFSVKGERRTGRVGIWISHGDGSEDKIAAIGVRVRHWVTFHGISLNVDPELEHFSGIVPCGVRDERFGVTSLAALGLPVSMREVDAALRRSFEQVFGPVTAS